MKRMLYLTTIFMLLLSCKSIDKLVEQGRYDEAIFLAIEKLAGKKNKKTKDVKAFERAFAKVMQRDIDRIKYLESQQRPENWIAIHDAYEKIRTRQNRVMPFLPLISKDGHVAQFKFVKVNDRLKEARDLSAIFYYDRGIKYLEEARLGEKQSAREAYHMFGKIDKYYFHYKDKALLAKEARELGKSRILVNLVNQAPVIFPESFESVIRSVHVQDLNSLWKEFHVYETPGVDYDLFAELQILDLQISPSLETRDHWTEKKKIEDGWEYDRDRQGRVQLDTAGNKIKRVKYKWVQADVTKTVREKEAIVVGNLVYRNAISGYKHESLPINVKAIFRDESYSYHGNKKALPNNIKHKVSPPLHFPSDYDLTMEVSENLKARLKQELSHSTW